MDESTFGSGYTHFILFPYRIVSLVPGSIDRLKLNVCMTDFLLVLRSSSFSEVE